MECSVDKIRILVKMFAAVFWTYWGVFIYLQNVYVRDLVHMTMILVIKLMYVYGYSVIKKVSGQIVLLALILHSFFFFNCSSSI